MKNKRITALFIACAATVAALSAAGCNKKGNDAPPPTIEPPSHTSHVYDRKVTESKYLKSTATCTQKALYYYSCECGEAGVDTFEYGDKLPHSFTEEKAEEEYLKSQATCTAKAVYYKSCSSCGEKGNDTFEYGQVGEHSYKNGKCAVCGQDDPSFVPNTDGFDFSLSADGNSYTVSGIGEVNVTDIIIPSEHDGKPVTEIADNAFNGNKAITSVSIPDSVTTIGVSAFFSCGALTEIKFGSGVKKVKTSAFQFCESLTKLEATVAQMCAIDFKNQFSNPLYYAHTLIENGAAVTAINVPLQVDKIGNFSFVGCNATALTVHDDVSSIGTYAFKDCKELKKVELGNGLTTIGTTPFAGCELIEYTEYENGLYLGNADNDYLILIKAKNVEIPDCLIHDETEYIMGNAFKDCVNITAITVPLKVSYIGTSAFYGCTSLKTVNYLAYKVSTTYNATLSTSPFSGCSAIENITIGARVSQIPKMMFRKCGVINLTFEGKKTKLLAKAFGNCANLTKISFLNGTKDEWNKLVKANDWAENTGDYVISCSDGDIAKS